MSHSCRRGFAFVLGMSLVSYASVVSAQDEPPPPDVIVVTPEPEPAAPPVVVVTQAAPAPEPAPVLVVTQDPRSSTMQTSETRRMSPLLISGFISFGVSYGAAVIVAATSDRDADQRLYIPVLGPWLDLADRGSCDIDNSSCDGETTNKVLLVIDGVFQGAGVLAVVGGILAPGSSTRTQSTTVSRLRVLPVSYGAGAPGIAAFGRF